MKKVYIAHAFGGVPAFRQGAAHWFTWACHVRGVMAIAPWIVFTLVWDESRKVDGIRLNLQQIAQCDEMWLCGKVGAHSPGMDVEQRHAELCGVPVFDLRTSDGLPPVE